MSASPSRIKNSRLSTAPLPSGSKTHHTASTICRMFRSEGMSAPSPKVLTAASDNGGILLQLAAAVLVPVLEPLVGGARYGRRWRPLTMFPLWEVFRDVLDESTATDEFVLLHGGVAVDVPPPPKFRQLSFDGAPAHRICALSASRTSEGLSRPSPSTSTAANHPSGSSPATARGEPR